MLFFPIKKLLIMYAFSAPSIILMPYIVKPGRNILHRAISKQQTEQVKALDTQKVGKPKPKPESSVGKHIEHGCHSSKRGCIHSHPLRLANIVAFS